MLGDLKVKIKDIINEGPGFISSYVTGLLPKSLADVADIPLRGRIDGQLSDKEKQEKADQMFAPGGEKDWGSPDDDSSVPGEKNVIADPSTSSPLHPEVKVFQSYPLVLQVKNKRYEMDEFGEFHPFGTNGKVTPAVQAFLSKERDKL